MISIEQIRQLQDKVNRMVEHLSSLQQENTLLRSRIGSYETRISELEKLIDSFRSDQNEIEQGILLTITQLETYEQVSTMDSASNTEYQQLTESTSPNTITEIQTDAHSESHVYGDVTQETAPAEVNTESFNNEHSPADESDVDHKQLDIF
jgi:chromosome segregation ATPase